jgi:pimeloyl-ACP methyl ester carboxylesterase
MNFEGHGGLASDENFSIRLFTKNTQHFIEQNKLENINIFGYSMGEYVALNTAVQYPQLINKIVTLGTKFDWNPMSSANEVKMLNPSKIKGKIPHFAEKLKAEHAPLDWEIVIKKTAKMMLA